MEDTMEGKFIPATSVRSKVGQEVVPDLYCLTIQIVNVCFVGDPDQSNEWVLVDAGMPESADDIISAATKRFGSKSRPKAIVLTHGHFDHVGAVVDLVREWNVPVYAHELEMPYLTGKSSYPKPDPTVEGGFVAKMSSLFPVEPIDLGNHVEKLPSDGSVPSMSGWRWIHTPGHTPGHISLFRETDRSLIAGDAFVTVKQESLYKVFIQNQEINGPPRYLTTDWQAAWESVKRLEALKPSQVVTGHGIPMAGEQLRSGLERLAKEFDRIAIPDYGRYIDGIH
ncbi:MBL fold metallo-hydrolase [Paenactinomyces guangxiensis]|uniref:MBL fold metallo-hydrolase n=1 Tax=Paenactinomyces guangxiensis TaxID=1490290 RepID=A0A7W1WP56_9BACL|nr:MBL fold metallo-hydrolase [Paenactinomyces guangxiensis]MBA4493509.1 MBL fold metallo-hydrolase [Paenactinomyces guangxiensis]MBH8590600.1 MBL fold metallo-hydrolase [Paenactinomyces guangxiensis]